MREPISMTRCLVLLLAVAIASPVAGQRPKPEKAKVVEPETKAEESPPEERTPTLDTSLDALVDMPVRAEDQPVFEETIQVQEVLIDVLVTDKDGRVVTGLGVDDFVIYEEGQSLRPESVTFYADAASLRRSGPGRSDRFFIFLFHHSKTLSSFQRSVQNRMARDAHAWLEQHLLGNDQVAVLSFDYDLWLHQDFTRDRERIYEAVDRAARGGRTRTSRGSPSRRDSEPRVGNSPSLFVNLPRDREFRRQTRTFQEALEMVAKGAGNVVGRKNMLLFSPGFGQVTGIGELHSESQIYKRMLRALNTSNVAVYGLDIQGIHSGNPRNAAYGSMSQLSWDTGGRYFERDADFLKPLQVVAAENTGYYLISYRSRFERGTSGYREVRVGTPREAVFVRARTGYLYGPSR